MIAQILEQERPVRHVLSEDRKVSHLVLKWQDIDVLTSVRTALEPLAIKPTLKFIENASEATRDYTNLTADLKARVQADFQKRYTSEAAQTILNTTTWLDPRYKTEYLTEDGSKNASENIKEQMMAIDLASNALSNTTNSTDDATDNQPPPAKKKKSLAKLLSELKNHQIFLRSN